MRAAGLVCLGAGAGLIRGDLREVRGTDVACRSGGVIVSVRGARPRAVPVLSRYHARLLAAARFAGSGLVCGGTDPGRRNITNPLIRALDGGSGPAAAGHLPAAGDLAGRLRGAAGAGHVHARGRDQLLPAARVTWSPGWSRPGRPTRCGCWGRAGHDRAGGVRGDHRRLRRRAADRGHAARRRAAPAAERPHPAGRHVPGPGRSPARPPHPGAPGPDQPARRRPAAAGRDRGLETRPAPAHLPADRAHLRPGHRRPRQGRARRAALRRRCRQSATTCSRPASRTSSRTPARRWPWTGRTWNPSPGPRRTGPATAPTPKPPGATARTTCCAARTSCSTAITCPPAIMMPEENRPGRPRARPPRHGLVVPARPGPRLRPRADRAARPGDPARRHPRRLRLRPPRRRRLGAAAARRRRRSSSRTCTRTTAAPRAPTTAPSSPTGTSTARARPARCWN